MKMITHRCKGSLKAEIPIRYCRSLLSDLWKGIRKIIMNVKFAIYKDSAAIKYPSCKDCLNYNDGLKSNICLKCINQNKHMSATLMDLINSVIPYNK